MDGIQFVEPTVSLVEEHDLVRKVELAYRICYKSEDKISDASKSLVQKLSNSRKPDRHTSPLEHAWIKVKLPEQIHGELSFILEKSKFISDNGNYTYIGNFRAFHDLLTTRTYEENNEWTAGYLAIRELGNQLHDKYPEVFPVIRPVPNDSKNDPWEISEFENYYTFHIVTSRDILQELARHRSMSFSVESTRYCNYGNRGYTFVIPRPYGWTNDVDWNKADSLSNEVKDHLESLERVGIRDHLGRGVGCTYRVLSSLELINNEYSMMDLFFSDCYLSAARYDKALQLGIKPQEARMLLPGALKTELFMTGTKNDWEKFLVLRNSPAAHPMIRYLAEKIAAIINNE